MIRVLWSLFLPPETRVLLLQPRTFTILAEQGGNLGSQAACALQINISVTLSPALLGS